MSLKAVRKRLGEILISAGVITEDQLQNALLEGGFPSSQPPLRGTTPTEFDKSLDLGGRTKWL